MPSASAVSTSATNEDAMTPNYDSPIRNLALSLLFAAVLLGIIYVLTR